jgi:hypothetical protein
MSLPRSHLESLQRNLDVHEERLAVLRSHQNALEHQATKQARDPNPKVRSPEWITNQREALDREIRIHEQLIKLGRNPKVLDALGDLAENRDYASEAARDPEGAARKRGIELPAKMTLRLDLEPDRVQLQIIYYEDIFPFTVTWNSDSGFSPPVEPSTLRKRISDVSSV